MTKICSYCKLEKAETEFYVRRASRDGLAFKCKSCCRVFEQTPQGKLIRIRAVRKYQATERGHEVVLKSNRKRTGTSKRRASSNSANRKYKKTPKGRIPEIRRRERKRGLDLQLTPADIVQLHVRFEHKCFNCGSTNRLTIDHHRPLSRGFGLSLQNAVLLCSVCNSSKCNKLPEQFYRPEQLEQLNALGVI